EDGVGSVCGSGLRRAFLLYFLHAIHQIVRLLQKRGPLVRAFNGVRFAAVEQVQGSHGVIIIGTQRDGLLQSSDSLIDQGTVLLKVLSPDGSRQRFGVLHLLFYVFLVVLFAHFAVRAESKRPVDHADPVVRLRVFRLQLNVLLVIGL